MNWRGPGRADRQVADLWGGVACALLLLIPLWQLVLPVLRVCPVRTITGLPCPSCGATRAAGALLEGDLLGAFSFNPLAALAGVVLIGGGLMAPLWVRRGGRVPGLSRPLPLGIRAAMALTLVANWAYLLIRGV